VAYGPGSHLSSTQKGILKSRAGVARAHMTTCKLLSHKWEYASGGQRACKRCGAHEHFDTLHSQWQPI